METDDCSQELHRHKAPRAKRVMQVALPFRRLLALATPIFLSLFLADVTHATETSLRLSSELGDYVGGGRDYFFMPSDGTFTGQRSPWFNTGNGVNIIFGNSLISRGWDLLFGGPNNQPLTVGVYENAMRLPFQTPGRPGLSVNGCNTLTGRFEVREITYGAGNAIDSFWATFEQHCEGGPSALFGEIRFNANVIVTVTTPRGKVVEQGNGVTFNATATEVNGNVVTLTASGVPAGATFTDNRDNTGTFAWTPGFDQSGAFPITIRAENNQGVTDTATTIVSVGTLIRVPQEFETIQAAINSAGDGSRILVAPGFYLENLDFLGKAIKVISESGPEMTIIDGDQLAPVVTLANKESSDAVLSGFTLQNGLGGVLILRSRPVLSGNVIARNVGDFFCAGGFGVAVSAGAPIIQDNTISETTALCADGHGVRVDHASSAQVIENTIINNRGGVVANGRSGDPTVIKGNIIYGNTSPSNYGGGIYVGPTAIVVGNLVVGNYAIYGGGIAAFGNPITIVNNTIANNRGFNGSEMHLDFFSGQVINNIIMSKEISPAVDCGRQVSPTFRANNLFGQQGPPVSAACALNLSDNILADPWFVDPTDGDYRLDVGSPVIDKGDNTAPDLPDLDLQGEDRIADGDKDGQAVVDIGAYEFVPNPGALQFSEANVSVAESAGPAVITVVRKGGNTGEVTVNFATSDGSAKAGADYSTVTGILTFADGETSKTFTVPITADSSSEGSETLNLRLSNPTGGAVLGSRSSAVLTITEPPVVLTVASFNPDGGIDINVSPSDNKNLGNGTTSFTRVFNSNTQVTLTAPPKVGDKSFNSWSGCDSTSGTTCRVTMNSHKSVTATYVTPPPISIFSPDGAATWGVGSVQSIQWTSSGIIGDVLVQLSRDGGVTWKTILKKTPNDLLQRWKVSRPATTQGKIRVCSFTNPSVCGTSELFTIR